MTKYVYVNSTDTETGKPTESALYHSGEEVELANLETDQTTLIRFSNNTATVTGIVKSIEHSGKRLVVETLKVTYEFEEVAAN